MANYRQIHVSIWKDDWFLDLDPKEKLLFIYLFSNEAASLSGLYKLPLKVIVFETGLDKQYIIDTLSRFEESGKVWYEDGIVLVKNMRRYHETKSPKVQSRINSDLKLIPDCKLKIRYLYGIDTSPQLKEEEEEKEEEDKGIPQPAAVSANVFEVYSREIGMITPKISDELIDAESEYSQEWIITAINESSKQNKRSWAYALAILKRWKVEGFQSNTKRNGGKPNSEDPGAALRERGYTAA